MIIAFNKKQRTYLVHSRGHTTVWVDGVEEPMPEGLSSNLEGWAIGVTGRADDPNLYDEARWLRELTMRLDKPLTLRLMSATGNVLALSSVARMYEETRVVIAANVGLLQASSGRRGSEVVWITSTGYTPLNVGVGALMAVFPTSHDFALERGRSADYDNSI